jgi:hypothetical protein
MQTIAFPLAYDNETAHRKLKLLMKQGKQLNIQIENDAWLSCQGVTGLRYQLNDDSWQWLLNYLQNGNYEDFGVFPSDISKFSFEEYKESKIRELVDNKCNVASIPFLRETQAFVNLRVLFKFGKLFFSIRRTDDFMDYLNENGL